MMINNRCPQSTTRLCRRSPSLRLGHEASSRVRCGNAIAKSVLEDFPTGSRKAFHL
jgi:hypothetical protein